jgi:hypothetical protein
LNTLKINEEITRLIDLRKGSIATLEEELSWYPEDNPPLETSE